MDCSAAPEDFCMSLSQHIFVEEGITHDLESRISKQQVLQRKKDAKIHF